MKAILVCCIISLSLACAAAPAHAQDSGAGGSSAPAAPAAPAVSLDEVLAAAEAEGPNLKLASLNVASSRASFQETVAKNGLALGATAGYSHTDLIPGLSLGSLGTASNATSAVYPNDTPQAGVSLAGPSTNVSLSGGQVFQGSSPSAEQGTTVSLAAKQTVFDGYPGGRANASVQQALFTYQVAQSVYDATKLSLIYAVKQSYYSLLSAQHEVAVQQATVAQSQEDLSRTQAFFGAQRATQLDVLQSQIALRSAVLNLGSAQNAVVNARYELSALLGWDLKKEYAVAETPAPPVPTLNQAEAQKTALSKRSELQQFELNIKAASVGLALQKSEALPVVSVNGGISYQHLWTAPTTDAGNWSAGISVSVPIIDGGLVAASVNQAQAQVDALKVQEAQEAQTIIIAVDGAIFNVGDANARLDLAQQNVQQAQGEYDLKKAQFGVGLATNLDVLTASSALETAQAGLEQAKNAYTLAILALDNALGE